MDEQELIYDWNTVDCTPLPGVQTVEFDDETLRDGVQAASVTDPDTPQKIELLHLMNDLGMQAADIGLPGAGPRMYNDTYALAKEIADQKLAIRPNCAARTVIADIEPIVEISQKTGMPIEASVFIGSSPIREYVENWTLDQMLQRTEEAVTYAKKNNLPVMYVTEDTTRSRPETLRSMYTTAIECGADRLCVADTVGHATPHGTAEIISFVRGIIDQSGESVTIDWHGHKDRGLSIINSITAVTAGATRVHGTALGVGERSGNTPMEMLLINFRLLGYIDNDLSKLATYCELASKSLEVPIPSNQPVIGSDAFRTCTGVHAAAVLKALNKGHRWLADRIYSSVPAEWIGRQQIVEIGPLSGASNVVFWLQAHGHDSSEEVVNAILQAAKQTNRRLGDKEINDIIQSFK